MSDSVVAKKNIYIIYLPPVNTFLMWFIFVPVSDSPVVASHPFSFFFLSFFFFWWVFVVVVVVFVCVFFASEKKKKRSLRSSLETMHSCSLACTHNIYNVSSFSLKVFASFQENL